MFIGENHDYIKISFSTNRYTGHRETGVALLDLFSSSGKHLLPSRWDTQQNTRRKFRIERTDDILEAWTAPEEWQMMFFYRESEPEAEIYVDIKRYKNAKFHEFTAYIRDGFFGIKVEVGELLKFAGDVANVIQPNHGFIAHKKQEARQSPSFTINERLPGIYWANYFGPEYIEFFGRAKLLAAPAYELRELGRDLILLLTADSPFNKEILFNDDIADAVKNYLGRNAFAGPNFPDEPCVTPVFDFSDVKPGSETEVPESTAHRVSRLQKDLERSGYQLVTSSESLLSYRGRDGSTVLIDMNNGSISLDLSKQ